MNNNLILIGTTHLIKKEEIENIILLERPDIIGVELCKTRFDIFVNGQVQQVQKEPETILGKISQAIKNKAQEEKIEYGSDMVSASKYAVSHNIPLLLVDRDVREVNDLMQKIPQNEQIGFMKELADFQTKSLKENTKQVNEDEVIRNLKTNYPVAFEFLINSREQFIIIQLLKALVNNPKKRIIVFLGRGHVKKIAKELNCDYQLFK